MRNFLGLMSVAIRLISMLILMVSYSNNKFDMAFEITVLIAFSIIFDLTSKKVEDE